MEALVELRLGPAPGRLLRHAPDWDGEETSISFDARSGDYWVLERPSQHCLQWLAAQPAPVGWLTAREQLAAAPAAGDRVLQALVHADLVAAWKDGKRVHLGAPDEAADGA